ncbi:uncharacterized protein [Leuresthes tenuis]|uniref:uncharacterized protein isoform X2 n=1 Tax=Leuresthes tenuis TaxID=355514 RepID=UPI003B50F404
MPAPKRGSAPHDSEPKMRKLDEDGEALSSKTAPATNSLKTGNNQEKTAAPRTKIKWSSSVEGANKPAKSSKQSSPPKDSSKATSDPPVKKAKLLKATSASSGEAPSLRANSNVSLKRTTSTESDDDLSNDGSKVDLFRERGDEDKARCIRKYSNRVKVKRKADESSSDLHETSQALPPGPADPVQMDHNYGRFSDLSCLQSTGEGENKESAESLTEGEKTEVSDDATKEAPAGTGSAEAGIKFDTAAEERKHIELKAPPSSGEMVDSFTAEIPVGSEVDKYENKEKAESLKSQKIIESETPALLKDTLCSIVGETKSGGEGEEHKGEKTSSTCKSERQTDLSTELVSEESKLTITCKTKERDCDMEDVTEEAGPNDSKLYETNERIAVPENALVKNCNPEGQTEENLTTAESAGISETQSDLKIQMDFKEEFNSADTQDQVTNAVISLCDDVNQAVGKLEEELEGHDREEVAFQSSPTVACSGALVEVGLSYGSVIAVMCPDTDRKCKAVHEQNQSDGLSKSVIGSEGEITPGVDKNCQDSHQLYDNIEKIPAEVKEDSTSIDVEKDVTIQSSAAPNSQIKMDIQTSNPDFTVKTQCQDADKSTTALSTNFHDGPVEENYKIMENEETVHFNCDGGAESAKKMETETVVPLEISNPTPVMQKQELQKVSEPITVVSTEMSDHVKVDKWENMKTLESAYNAEGQNGTEMQPIASFEQCHAAKAEVQVQENPVIEPTTDRPVTEDPESANCKISEDTERFAATESQKEVDMHTTASSEEVCNMKQIVETHCQMNQVVSEPITDKTDELQKDAETANWESSEDTECFAATESQIEVDMHTTASSEEVCNMKQIVETHCQMNQVVSEPITDKTDELQKDPGTANWESSEDTECFAATASQIEVDIQTTATTEEVCNVTQIVEAHDPVSQVDSEPTTDTSDKGVKDLDTVSCKRSEDAVSTTTESQVEADLQTAATSEEVCNIAPVLEVHSQMVSEPTADISTEFHKDHKVENLNALENGTVKLQAVTVSQMDEGMETSTLKVSNPAPLVEMIESQREVAMQTQEYSSDLVSEVEIQSQKSQDISGRVTDDMSEEAHEDLINAYSQNVRNEDQANSERVTVQENEINMEMQITSASEISKAAFSEEMQNEKTQTEVDMQRVSTSERVSTIPAVEIKDQKIQDVKEQNTDTLSVTVAVNQNKMEMQPESKSEISISSPPAETLLQKCLNVTETAGDMSEKVQENLEDNRNENEALTECGSTAERPDEMEMQTAEEIVEISQPAATAQMESKRGHDVCELITDTEVEKGSIDTESEENKNSVGASENRIEIHMQTDQRSDFEIQNQERQEVSEVDKNPETFAAPDETSYPAAVAEQNHVAEEIGEHTYDFSGEVQTPLPIANLENEEKDRQTEPGAEDGRRDADLISVPIERADSASEEEMGRQVINEVKAGRSVSNVDGGAETNEVIVFVCGQPDDTDIVIQSSEDQIKTANQSEIEHHENQVVYEPISSPESDGDRELCTTSELHEGLSLLNMQSTVTQHTEGGVSNFSTNKDISHPKLQDEEHAGEESCVSDNQAAVEMEVQSVSEPQSPAHAQLEHSGAPADVKQVAAVSSSDDIRVTDDRSEDAAEKSERNGFPESVSAAEVSGPVQEDVGLQEAADVTGTTTPATTEVEITAGVSEEFVILEPVPESEIHFDIVTQAAAESGLSASLSEDVTAHSLLVDEEANQNISSGAQETVYVEEGVQQCEIADGVKDATGTSSGEVLDEETKANILQDVQNSDHQLPSGVGDVEMTNSHIQDTNEDSDAVVMENEGGNLDLQEVQILEDMEIGREIVVAEEEKEEDSDVTIIEKPQDQPNEDLSKKSEEKVNEKNSDDVDGEVKLDKAAEKTEGENKGKEVGKPKKQEMNTQARTKARLAALAEQKAAASKRAAHRQQLNLLALCQEIAEDIATDSMLLKRIEEEKQAAAAAVAAAAAKAEASKKERPALNTQDTDPVNVPTPAGPEGSSASVTPAPEAPATQPSTANSDETKPAAEPQKRRFFISQIAVPLKAHEKKKLTRYQRLRQVELQREKMSWARVKKLKSDQANQMFSDVDWQAPFSTSSLFSPSPATPPPAASPLKTPPQSPATTSKPAQPKANDPKVETPKAEPAKPGTTKTEPIKTETAKPEPTKTEASKTLPVNAETTKAEPPVTENRRTTRQSKAQASKTAAAPVPAPKVTRSAAKRTLPAMPPPMPNGLNAQKVKLEVEYKPYRPRPKYSPDDFELDDDPLPVRPTKSNLSSQPPRPSLQSNLAAHSKATPPLKPTVSSQLAHQAKLKTQTSTPRQFSGQSKPTVAAQAQLRPSQSNPSVTATPRSKAPTAASSKPVSSTNSQLKSPVLTAAQSKAASSPGQPRPAAFTSPQSKTAGAAQSKQSAPTAAQAAVLATCETQPAAAATADAASVPQKPPNPPSLEDDTSKNTAGAFSSAPASSSPPVESSKVSDDSQQCEEKPAEDKTEAAKMEEKTSEKPCQKVAKPQSAATPLSDACLQKEVKKLKEADKDATQTVIDAGQKHFGAVACSVCGMLYSAANPEDESQHLLFHNQFISAVKYVGWKKERILAEYPDGKIILVLPDDPKYALKKVEEIREMVDNDLGFQQVETKCPSQTKTFLFISIDKKVAGCLITEHIQEGYRVIEDPLPEGSEGEKVMFERQRAWCCSTTPEPAICGISRIWVVSMMRRQGIASRMLECLRNNFIFGSYLSKDEIAFSDPTPDGKLFATHYFGTSQFLVYNFVSGTRSSQPKTPAV